MCDGNRINGWCDRYGTTGSAVIRAGSTMPVFDTAIDVEDGVISPAFIPNEFGITVPVILMASAPGHDVDRRTATKCLPMDGGVLSFFKILIWGHLQTASHVRFLNSAAIERVMYLSYISIATCFKKKNFDVWIFGEPGLPI
jgi:hypothetical protein